jgi:hypothetical protein
MLVPLNTPVSSIVPPNRQVIWAGSRIEVAHTSGAGLVVTRTLLSATQPSWSLLLDASGGDHDLVQAEHAVLVVADRYLLLKTCARGASGKQADTLHHIGGDGRLRWSLPARTLDQVGMVDDTLLIVQHTGTQDERLTQPPMEAHLREPASGRSLVSYPVPVPAHLWPTYGTQRGAALRALLEHDGEHFAVRASLALAEGAAGSLFLHVLPPRPTIVRRWGFVCPDCLRAGSLQITHSLQLPPDSQSDDITLQVVACNQCSFRGLATYEESHRGALTAEGWRHNGCRADGDTVRQTIAAIARCPNPQDAACTCAVHQQLGARDSTGRWMGLAGCAQAGLFPMRLVQNQ